MNEKKVILITGCSSGIGYHLARLLSEQDHYVVYATSRNIDHIGETFPSNVIVKKLDVCCEDEMNSIVDDILKEEQKIDVLVYCVGIGHFSPVEWISGDELRTVMNTNAISLMSLTAKVLPSMKKRSSGHIVAVSAMSGVIGIPFNSVYSASKFAVEGYCESVREELKDYYINVNLIEPGPVFTDFDKKCFGRMTEFNLDAPSQKLLDTFKLKNDASYQTMGQLPVDVAQQILRVLESPQSYQLRFITNETYSNALSKVFKETSIGLSE